MVKDKIYLSSSNTLNIQDFVFFDQKEDNASIAEFEDQIEEYLKKEIKVACLSSGTSAIHLALILSGVARDDEVLCQSFTFAASANPIIYQGAKPIFIDSESDTWNICPVYLENAILDRISKGKKPKAIIAVHLYGMPGKMDLISKIARKYNITLIEDAAEALGSTYKGQKCGTFGGFGILSFNSNKIITSFGGGALICENEEQKQKAIYLATQARDNKVYYQHSEIGYNYRISTVLAGIVRGQMKVLEGHVRLRRGMNQFYQELFKNIDGIEVFVEPTKDYFSNHWLSCITVDEQKTGFTREEFRLALLEANIESRPLWKPMHLQPVFKDCNYYGDTVSEDLFKNGLCLPSGSNLTEEDRMRIKESMLEFILKR